MDLGAIDRKVTAYLKMLAKAKPAKKAKASAPRKGRGDCKQAGERNGAEVLEDLEKRPTKRAPRRKA